MSADLICPHCGAHMQSRENAPDQNTLCGACGREIEVASTRDRPRKGGTWCGLHWAVWFLIIILGYEQIRLDEPWNSPHNRRFTTMSVYQCPSDPDQPEHYTTDYLMITGPGTVGDGPNGTTLREITDGPANTLLIAETRNSGVNWMQPVDLDAETMPRRINGRSDPSDPLSIASYHPGLANVLFCDGSVRSLSDETPTEMVEAMLTKDGGETVESPDP